MILISWFDPENPSYRRYAAWLGVEPLVARSPGGRVYELSAEGEVLDELASIPWEKVRGFLLPGGGDVDWRLSGASREFSGEPNPERDEFELRAIQEALGRSLPILGICRGHQVINVSFRGTLSNLENKGLERVHRKLEERRGSSDNFHWIEVENGSILAEIIGPGKHLVNSAHHQAVATLGDGLSASAFWEEGGERVIEAVELPGKWVLGVQWHPERFGAAESAALREAFLRTAGVG